MEKNETTKRKKRALPESEDSDDVSRTRRPRRAAACTNFKEKPVHFSEKSDTIEAKKQQIVEDEFDALQVTSLPSDDALRSTTRRLTDFILHDSDGVSQPLEMLEISDIFISGVILPLDECSDKDKRKGVRCQSFGRVDHWHLTGYEDGSPVIWISTELADYDCRKPNTSYKKIYDYFFQKACASIAVYKRLSKSAGGDPDTSLDELLAAVVSSMIDSKYFSSAAAIQEFVIHQVEFIYNQLAGLDKTAKKHETSFAEMSVLVTLRDENSRLDKAVQMEGKPSNRSLRIDGVSEVVESEALTTDQLVDGADEDRRYAKLLQDEEYRKSVERPRKKSILASAPKNVYIKIDEDEIANDYPLPSYYKISKEETDELLLSDTGYEVHPIDLPRRTLHNWALYNSDLRLISLELLPMKQCDNMDVTIFGSGVVTDDDGKWVSLDDTDSSMESSQSHDPDGMNIFLSQIKEWMIEFGGEFICISLRTDMAWYRLGKPSKHYTPWYEPVLKTARVGISIITLLEEQSTVAKLSFAEIMKRLTVFQENDNAYISPDIRDVERYLAVHGQIISQLFAEYPMVEIRRSPFVTELASVMEQRNHTKWKFKRKKILQIGLNLNPRAGMAPVVSKRKAMRATTRAFIWSLQRCIWSFPIS